MSGEHGFKPLSAFSRYGNKETLKKAKCNVDHFWGISGGVAMADILDHAQYNCYKTIQVSRGFYESERWRVKRENILRRDGYECQNCKRYGRHVQATEVHHIKHLEDRPELAFTNSNLISLCKGCHNKAHPEKGGYNGGRRGG